MLVLVAMALVIGSAGSVAAYALIKLIALVTQLAWFGRFDTTPVSLADAARTPWMVAVPVIGGLLIGLMARFGSEKIRGHGIPEAIEAILIGQSRMSPKVAILKPLSSAISIGTGGPFGAEGPIIMTGGAIGSLFAQFFHLSSAERKTLLVAGAASGMTAIFGTPMAAVLLAVELLLFEWRPRSFLPVTAAALTATAWRPLVFESGPLFAFSGVPALPWWGLAACAMVGILAGLQSALLTKCLYTLEDLFERLPIHWMWWPAIGGLCIGLGGLIEPRALGVGYDVIGDLLAGHLLVQAVLAILVVKAAIWLLALSSGTSGGVLAPLLILGGAMGWLVGGVLPGNPGFWALLGMAAMLGGTMRAPLTGAVFAAEITGDLHTLPALLAATAAAYAVTVLILKRSILTEKIARRGQHITREYGIDPFELTRVRDVMVSRPETLSANMTVTAAVETVERGEHRTYPVIDAEGRPIAVVSGKDALHWKMSPGGPEEALAERLTGQAAVIVHPGDVVARAVDLMLGRHQGCIAVTEVETGRLTGIVTRRDLLKVRAEVIRSEGERRVYFARRNPLRRGACERAVRG
ncbi:chloride channel protein [Methylobacterium gnaphalii]|uniref:Chloride channel protein n=1 Tax=Methylobacterium gnaphalii TaxID=1010610 RepID=A0A512JPM2_9HYPH|nr:chloride channel protein [Methylobacterium gnaphalii]GLS47666.1 chloride channel protein [Methylobacterium gnaphalii]